MNKQTVNAFYGWLETSVSIYCRQKCRAYGINGGTSVANFIRNQESTTETIAPWSRQVGTLAFSGTTLGPRIWKVGTFILQKSANVQPMAPFEALWKCAPSICRFWKKYSQIGKICPLSNEELCSEWDPSKITECLFSFVLQHIKCSYSLSYPACAFPAFLCM